MKTITIASVPGFDEWRNAAKQLLHDHIPPENIVWRTDACVHDDLFGEVSIPSQTPLSSPITVSKTYLDLCTSALCHKNDERFSLCYRILWRLTHENKNLLHHKTDDDVITLTKTVKAVRRDAYKITAFLRFREIDHNGEPHFIAWYEPEHYSLELKLNFFKTRFKNMRWSILTPYRAAHWDMTALTLEDNPDPSTCPQDDHIEKYWLTYYANIFNPARPKKGAMLSQMPKKYWKNMPETALIKDLLYTSEHRARKMIKGI